MRRALAALGVALAATLGLAAPASAQAGDGVIIRKVDTTAFPTVKASVQVSGATPQLSTFTLRENGRIIPDFEVVPIGKTTTPVGVVLVIDVSGSMRQNGAVDQAKAAAKQFVAAKEPNVEIAVVAFSSEARIVANFTKDVGLLNGAIDGLVATGETALWDGVSTGSSLLSQRQDLQPNLLVLSDGTDTVSKSTFDTARSSVLSAKAALFAIGLQGGDFDEGPIRSLAESTNGQYLATTTPQALGAAYETIQQTLQNQYEVTYTSASTGTLELTIGAGGRLATASGINTGTVSQGTSFEPEYVDSPPTPGFLEGSVGKLIAAAAALAAAGFLAYALLLIAMRGPSDVERVLQPYVDGRVSDEEDEGRSLIETPFVQRAVEATGRFAERRGIRTWAEGALERADLPLQASEAIFFYAAMVVLLAIVGFFLGGLFLMLILFAASAFLPLASLSFLADQRKRKFTTQLPDTLQLLAGTLRAGYSLLQGVEAVSQEVEDPMGRELRRVLAEARLGRPLEDALEDCAGRMGSPDFDWAIMAIRIQREVGGNLAELLDIVSDTMLQRERLRREVRALTAEGRISAIILGILPIGLGLVLYSSNREYMEPLFEDSLGKAMLFGSGALAVVGFYWMKKTIEIEV